MSSQTPNSMTCGSFARGQALGDVAAGAIAGSFAAGQAQLTPPSPERHGSFATGQATTDPSSWPTGRFCTGQDQGDPRLIRQHFSVDPRPTAETGAVD